MRKLVAVLFIALLAAAAQPQNQKTVGGIKTQGGVTWGAPGTGGGASFDVGFEFRATSSFVTTLSGDTDITLSETYPTTRSVNGSSVTFGLVNIGTAQSRDRNASNDARLAGIIYGTSSDHYFRVDLPAAGTYQIHVADGDELNAQTEGFIVQDSTTSLYTLGDTSTGANQFADANGNVYSNTAWPGSETAKQLTFSTTEFRIYYSPSGNIRPIAYLRIVRIS